MTSPVRGLQGAYPLSPTYSADEMFGYNEEIENAAEPEPDPDQAKIDEIWGAYYGAIQSGSYLKLYQLAEKYRFNLVETFSFEDILDKNLQSASKKEHFDALSKLALAEQMFYPESLFARVIQALSYRLSGNHESAFSILKNSKDEEANLEIGKQIGWMIVRYRENRTALQHLLDLMAFYSKNLSKINSD